MTACQCPQDLGTFLDFETSLTEEFQLFMRGWNGRCVDNKRRLGVLAGMGNLVNIFFIVDQHPLFFKLMSKV